MALKDCYKKIGKALSEKDKAEIQAYIDRGMSEKGAVNRYLSDLKKISEESLDENLLVTHNLSEENLKHVLDLGGIAAPSLAVQAANKGFGSFGEITLIGDPSMIEDKTIKFFDSDIYSPRQPRAVYKANRKIFQKVVDDLEIIGGIDVPSIDRFEEMGARHFQLNTGLQYNWLKSQGLAPKPVREKLGKNTSALLKHAKKKHGDNFSYMDLNEDPKFIEIKKNQLIKSALDRDLDADAYLSSDGEVSSMSLDDAIHRTLNANETDIDKFAFNKAIRKKISVKKNQLEYEKYADRLFNRIVDKKQFFVGFNNQGTRIHKDYTLENVVKNMIKDLRAGEGFNYGGAGYVRASVAKKIATIASAKRKRNKILSDSEMEAVKEESDAKLDELLDSIKGSYKYGDGMGYRTNATEIIMEYATGKSRITEGFDESVREEVDEFLEYLAELPTGYFEGKAQRAMDLSEFTAAVIPSNASKETVQVLRDAGLKVSRYNYKEDGRDQARIDSVIKAGKKSKVFFQGDKTEYREISEGDAATIKTGDSVQFNYRHNTESATGMLGIPDKNSPYGRGYEPSGKFISIDGRGKSSQELDGHEYGRIKFKNPLVVDNNSLQWKKTLSDEYNGLTGKELSKAIIADGHDAIITTEGDRYISEIVDLSSFDESKAMYQEGDDSPRASLSIMADGSREINLTYKSDASSVPHELGHLFLEVEKQLANDFGVSENQSALLSWLGVNSFDGITTEHHEKFAETFEVYLESGKAPSPPLREVFSKFREWIANVYKGFLKDPRFRADLSEESRFVFDRLFATEEQIAQMEQTPAFVPLFRSKEQAGMTDEEYAEYLKRPSKVRTRAQERLDKELMKVLTKRKSNEWNEEKKFIVEDEIERLKETRVYQLTEELQVNPLQLEELREHLGLPAPVRGDDRFIPEKTDSLLILAAKKGGLDMGQWSGQGTPEEVTELGNNVRTLIRNVQNTDENNPKSLEKWIGHTPQSLHQFIVSIGGFTDQLSPEAISEFKSRDIKFPKIIRKPSKKGGVAHSTDDIALAVAEAGYFSESDIDSSGRVSFDDLFDALEQSIEDENIYTIKDNDLIQENYLSAIQDYEYYVENLGLNEKSTNQDIALAVNVGDFGTGIDVDLLKDKSLNNRMVGKPVFRKNSGMSPADLVALAKEHGFGEMITEDNVVDMVTAEIAGEDIISPEGQKILMERDRELAEKGSDVDKQDYLAKFVKKHGRQDGADPALVAELFGYENVEMMINEVAFALPIKKQAEVNAENIMVAQHGDILNDGTIEKEVEAALENEEQAKLLLSEVKALGRKSGNPDRINKAELKSMAVELIGTMKFSEIKPNKFYRAAMKASERAGEATNEEDQLKAKIQQLANHYLYREALSARENIERQTKYVKKMQTKKWRTNEVGGDYRRIIGLVANMYDAKKVSGEDNKAMQDVMSILNWYNTQVENDATNYANILDHNLIKVLLAKNEAQEAGEIFDPTSYKFPKLNELSVSEMQGLYDQLRHFRFIGGKEAKAKTDIDATERAEFVESVNNNGGKDFRDDKGIPDKDQSLKRDWRHYLFKNISLLNMVRKIDNDFKNDDGLAHKKIYRDIEDANSRKIRLHGEMYELMKDRLSDIYKLHLDRKKWNVALESGATIPMTTESRFMLAMYWGTESSREAIMDGHGMTENDVIKILSGMSDAELNTVNEMWEINEHLWPELVKTVVAHEGVAPAKLDPTPFEINGIKLTGGHQRLFYDSLDIEIKNEQERAVNSAKIMPSKAGSAHARVGSGGKPVLLDLSNVTRSIDDVIHYIAFADTGARVRSIINAKDVKSAIENKHGVGFHRALVEQINSITGNKQASYEIPAIARTFRYLRGAATARHLMYSVRNTVQQVSAIPIAMQEVGTKNYLESAKRFYTREGHDQIKQFVNEKSAFMSERASFVNREAAENIRKLGFENTKMKKMYQTFLDNGFAPQTYVDSVIAYPAWISRYEQAMAEHGDEGKAISQADSSIAESVGSGSDLHLSGLFQSTNTELVKSWSIFGSWFASYFQRMYRDTEGFTTANSKDALYTLVTTPLLSGVIAAALIMDLPDEESKDENWAKWALIQYAKFMGGTVIFLRDAVSFQISGFTPKSTIAGLFDSGKQAAKAIEDTFDPESEGERTGYKNASDVIKAMSSGVKIPASGNVTRVLDYMDSSAKGNEESESKVLRPYQALVEGKNKN